MTDLRRRSFKLLQPLLAVANWVIVAFGALLTAVLVFSFFKQPGAYGAQLKLGTAIVFLTIAWTIVRELLKLLAHVATGDAFHPANGRSLRIIAGALVVGELLPLLAMLVLPARVIAEFGKHEADPGNWFAIIVVLILSEVFRQGTLLRDDARHTV